MVTGATSGIGHAFARHLAAQGYRLVLVARDGARLATRREELLAAGSPAIELIPADLTEPAQRTAVADRLRSGDAPVDLLVNNAGGTLGVDFIDAAEEDLIRQVDLLVMAVMVLTRAALPGMRARGHGGVINVASTAGLVSGRGSTYAASKAWVVSFSEGLAMQLRGTGVRIQALCPGFVRTEFHQRAHIDMSTTPAWAYLDVDKVVRTSLDDLRANRPLSVPGALYKTVAVVSRLAPRSLVRRSASRIKAKGRT